MSNRNTDQRRNIPTLRRRPAARGIVLLSGASLIVGLVVVACSPRDPSPRRPRPELSRTAKAVLTSSGCPGFISAPSATPAFCDTFDEGPAHNPASDREGQLDGTVWGASRYTGNQNFGSSANDWAAAQLSSCGSTALVNPPNEASRSVTASWLDTAGDGGTVTALAMYPKQPSLRLRGAYLRTIAFDVSNDSQGSHATWPELWMSDQPIPVPFTHEGIGNLPQNGFGIRLAGCPSGACAGTASVDSAVVVADHVANDSFFGGSSLVVHDLASVERSRNRGSSTTTSAQVSQHQIDVIRHQRLQRFAQHCRHPPGPHRHHPQPRPQLHPRAGLARGRPLQRGQVQHPAAPHLRVGTTWSSTGPVPPCDPL